MPISTWRVRLTRSWLALSGQTPTADNLIVEQLINGELVLQAMGSTSSVGDGAQETLTALLATYDRSADDLDELLAAAALDRKEFDRHFARLVTADAFARVQASDSGISVDEYVQALQQNAHISYGPLATQLLSTKLDSSVDGSPAAQPTAAVTENEESDQSIAAMAVTPPAVDAKPVVEESFGTQIGQLAPQFQLQSLTESAQPLTLDDLRGQPLVLSFWTTWCPYCLRQTPVLVAGYDQYADQGIAFVGIDVQEEASAVQSYVDQHGIQYPILLDRDGTVAAAFAVGGYPTTYFLDRDGRIVAKQVGTLSAEQLTQYIDQIDQE